MIGPGTKSGGFNKDSEITQQSQVRKNIPRFLPFATLPTTMRFILLFLALVSYVTAQSVSPCITICVEDICPKGYSDPGCFCGSPFASINSCVSQTCTPLAYQQWPGLVSTYCNCLFWSDF